MRTPLDLILSGDVAGLITAVEVEWWTGWRWDNGGNEEKKTTKTKNNDDDTSRAHNIIYHVYMSNNTLYYVSPSSV